MKGFDESFRIASGEDTEFSYRMQKAGRKMVFNQNAVTFHTHPVSFLKYLRIKFYRAFWRTKVYGRHRAKMAKDSYTSQMVKGQTALVYLSVLSLAGTPLFPESGVLAFAFLLLLFLSSLPFAAWAMRKDFVAGVLSPVFVFFRAVAFSAGLAAGMARGLAFK